MQYPALIMDKAKIKHNTKVLSELANNHGIKVAGVTKVLSALPDLAEAMLEGGAYALADSRIENLIKLKAFNVPKLLLRIPMLTQAADVVQYADISLNSEIEVIKALNEAAKAKNKVHQIILMVDLGDLREGVWYEKTLVYTDEIIKLDNIRLLGLGTNLTCYGGVIPSTENLSTLVAIAEEIEGKYGIKLEVISGGNSSSVHLLLKNQMPKRVNQIRLGEAIVLGTESAYGERIEGTYNDAFSFVAEIVELKEKPSMPIGEIGMDAFGGKPVFQDNGIIKRAIVAAGRQDVKHDGLIPRDKGINILGASSDHMILDVTNAEKEYKVGDTIEFNVNYGALLASATSEYVNKLVK
ncbi:MAG: alanine racemase [Clostridiales bacterium GWB2_37_7]|nr:MAG: alanine racemase [Clostridiales bacterium GWB2_37_7]